MQKYVKNLSRFHNTDITMCIPIAYQVWLLTLKLNKITNQDVHPQLLMPAS
jgi:hypothetical protein